MELSNAGYQSLGVWQGTSFACRVNKKRALILDTGGYIHECQERQIHKHGEFQLGVRTGTQKSEGAQAK